MYKIQKYLSFVKFAHTIFAMPFAIIGYSMAIFLYNISFNWLDLLKIVLSMIFARNAAMGFNRYADRHIDMKNSRTKNREIPAGKITSKQALSFILLNVILFITTTWFINLLCFKLSFITITIILGYSLTKRFTWLCHFILGVGLSLAPIGAFIAVTGYFALPPVLLSFAVLFWVSGFDIVYALQDDKFDNNEGLFSVPSYFGRKKALLISRTVHVFSSVLLFFIGYSTGLGLYYYLGVVFFSLLLIYQQSIVSSNNLSKINIAFFSTNGIASLVFAIITICSMIFN